MAKGNGGAGGGGKGSGRSTQADVATKERASRELPSGVSVNKTENFLGDPETVYSFKVGGKKIEMSYAETSYGSRHVGFEVGGSYAMGNLKNPRDRREAALKLARIQEYDVKRQKNGTLYSTIAYKDDGHGDYREKAYKGRGFSKPDYLGMMYGVVKKGKLVPANEQGKAL